MPTRSVASAFPARACAATALLMGMSVSQAAPTSLEVAGLLLGGTGTPVTAPYVIVHEGLYDRPEGGTLLLDLGLSYPEVVNGSFLQRLTIDDGLFVQPAYLQITMNGTVMGPRLDVLQGDSGYFASGVTTADVNGPLLQFYAGLAAPVPEPGIYALMAGGLALLRATMHGRAASLLRAKRPVPAGSRVYVVYVYVGRHVPSA